MQNCGSFPGTIDKEGWVRNMKVAMLIRKFVTTGGAERYAVEVASRLANKCELHVYTQETSVELPDITFHKISRFSEKPRYLNQFYFNLQVNKLKEHYDIVHSHERVSNFDVLTIHCPTFKGGYLGDGVPDFRRLWRHATSGFSPRIAYYLWQEKQQFRCELGRRFIAVSRHVMNDVITQYSLNESDFDFAYPGVNLEKFLPVSAAQKEAERKKLKLGNSELVICFVGTEFERKGLRTLIEALGILKDEPIRLLVAGAGNVRPFENEAIQLGIRDKIFFLGLVQDVQAVYAASDLFILPTLSDPCPMAPLEAMASGLPVIMSNANITGVAEHVKKSEAILLNDPRSASELADVIKRMQDSATRSEYISKGLQLVQEITWDKTARETLKSYERSMAIRKGRA